MILSRRTFGALVGFLLLFLLVLVAGLAVYMGSQNARFQETADNLSPSERESLYQTHYLLGKNHYESADPGGALTEYGAMIELFPNRPEPYALRAAIENGLEHSTYAVADDTKALDHMSSCVTGCGPAATAAILSDRAKANVRMGKFDLALADANKALKLAPDAPGAHLARGSAEAETNPRAAIADINWATAHNEGWPEWNGYRRSFAEAKLGEFTAAANDAEPLIAYPQGHPEFYAFCAWYEFKAGRLSQAINHGQIAVRLGGGGAVAFFNLGLFYAVAGDETNAHNIYSAALIAPGAADALPTARNNIADQLKLHPNNPLLHKSLEWISKS